MKATGIVRRIDDLGRVVIPKEIRRTLRIREGDPLEIFTDREGEIILKKYSPIGELSAFARQYADRRISRRNISPGLWRRRWRRGRISWPRRGRRGSSGSPGRRTTAAPSRSSVPSSARGM